MTAHQQPPEDSDETSPDQNQGTSPLRPLPPEDAGQPSGEIPPATVLRNSTKGRKPPLPTPMEETHRVRLIPRIPNPPPWRLILRVEGPGKTRIGLDVRQPLTLGRTNPAGDNNNPDLDLTPYLAAEHGVSRLHAVLIPAPEALYLGDLDSANGTWINGDYLEPGERHVLAPGDKIELGLLKLAVLTVTLLNR